MKLVATTLIGYVAAATFLFWYIPFITRNKKSWTWLPTHAVYFLFGDGYVAAAAALILQVVVPAALVGWCASSVLRLLFVS